MHIHFTLKNCYSLVHDSGPSEIGTQYNRPLYKGHRVIRREDNLSTKDTTAEFYNLLSPTFNSEVPLIRKQGYNLHV